ncbi:hypothetical protein LzC2_18670 [Planctomycetes bacterium LzC2]|uniref:Uncharacterized protein n=1 Tax=Alienimonas chondri TaxID=2681879 RepID=A0ABX1VD23_9PLAN|nr:hypothetical protein [Alienimonas chondri]
MNPFDWPLICRVWLGLAVFGAVWGNFGIRPIAGRPDRRRPKLVAWTAIAATAFVLGPIGFRFVAQFGPQSWWPMAAVGAACFGSAALGRCLGRRLENGARWRLAAAGAILLASPGLAASEILWEARGHVAYNLAVRLDDSLAPRSLGSVLGDIVFHLPPAATAGVVCWLLASATTSRSSRKSGA